MNISISITEQQHEVLNTLCNPAINFQGSVDNRLEVTEVIDDNSISVYYIDPQGHYFVESLEDGFNQGWTRFDSDGNELPWD